MTHLFFANDVLLFYKPRKEAILNLRYVLMGFQAISDLSINFAKSEKAQLGNLVDRENLANAMGCALVELPILNIWDYHWVLTTSKVTWEPIMNRFEQRLAGWKRNLLSKGERLTLINSTLCNILKYYLSLITIPVGIARK